MTAYRILLVDDHKMFRQGIRRIIEENRGLEVVGEAGDGLEALTLMKKMAVDMVIVDIAMPNLRGIETTRELKSLYPKVKVLILTMYKDRDFLVKSISAGADGYLVKEDADIELFTAIDAIRKGEIYISPLLDKTIRTGFIQMFQKPPKFGEQELTLRQAEIVKLIAEGKSSREIAELLSISVRTVEGHRAAIMKRLGLKKETELVKYAIRKNYISDFE